MSSPSEQGFGLVKFLRTLLWLFKIFWKIDRRYFVTRIVTEFFEHSEGLVYSYLLALAIDGIVDPARAPAGFFSSIIGIAGAFFVYNIVFSATGLLSAYSGHRLTATTGPRMELLLYEKLVSLGVETLEQPVVNNQIERAKNHIAYLNAQVNSLSRFVSFLLTAIGAAFIIISHIPFAVLPLVAVVLPHIFLSKKYLAQLWRFRIQTTEAERSARESITEATNTTYLHELVITRGHTFLSRRFRDFSGWLMEKQMDIRKVWFIRSFVAKIGESAVLVASYAYVFLRFLADRITIGEVTFAIGAMNSFNSSLIAAGNSFVNLYEGAQKTHELMELFVRVPKHQDGAQRMEKLSLGPEIRFEHVSFSYPESREHVIHSVNLRIRHGEKIAIVGHNGAGKTTLVKLLCRFYRASSGDIQINGRNINDIAIDTWYDNVGVLFQEYPTYPQLNAQENIFLGRPEVPIDAAQIRSAAAGADADSFIASFPAGYDQVLSEKYHNGIRPSTGQWQKIAIARFFYRDAPLVIFDEPTASIDAVSEYAIFNKIYESFVGKTVIIISHRFSTVRNADRIIVLDQGKIVEQGSHDELMAQGGVYAKAFLLQAEGYRTGEKDQG